MCTAAECRRSLLIISMMMVVTYALPAIVKRRDTPCMTGHAIS